MAGFVHQKVNDSENFVNPETLWAQGTQHQMFYSALGTGRTRLWVVADVINFPNFRLICVEFLILQVRNTHASYQHVRMHRCFLTTTLKILRKAIKNKDDLNVTLSGSEWPPL